MCTSASAQTSGDEVHRPMIHFSPRAHWVNDPNGMVYNKGIYHLFYQYHPFSSIWGPMHWGHATSKDLINWDHQPIALFPDSLGTIFSGSAVLDVNNTSGFGKNGEAPLVAIFTHHDTFGERSGRIDFQNQGIAFSNDNGQTWSKYSGNPILKNPGVRDFRDPKVMWFEPLKKWIMTLAVQNRVSFYSSANLKEWVKESDFGLKEGAHGGVWECPDLFTLDHNGKKVWVLFVSINPGGPNKGSATQYFLGDFDGKRFVSNYKSERWIDYGPDNYAGVTWSNTGNRRIFLGWMSNWTYAMNVPTETWKNAMTIPRELKLKQVGDSLLIASMPVAELKKGYSKKSALTNVKCGNTPDGKLLFEAVRLPGVISLKLEEAKDFSLVLSNSDNEELLIGFNKVENRYYINRSKSGKVNFHKEFAGVHTAPRLTAANDLDMTLLIDASSVELFADGGLTSMTEIYFSNKPYTKVHIRSTDGALVRKVEFIELKGFNK
jgi:fructan beta-fructosidase